MDIPIKNIDDLRGEIVRLKVAEQQQAIALQQRFKNPLTFITSIFSSGSRSDGSRGSGFFDQDIATLISSVVLPLTLNKTIFRNSNFFIKGLINLLAQKASYLITDDTVKAIWQKISALFSHKEKNDTEA